MNRRTVFSWCLYDFGNSSFAALFITIFATYYTDTVVGNTTGLGDLWWSRIASISMAVVALSSPFLGGIADHAGLRKRLLAVYTFGGVAAVLCFSALSPGAVWPGFLLGLAANIAFEGGAVFYNSYLPDIAPPAYHGRVSAWGFGIGYVGSLVALGLAYLSRNFIAGVWIAIAAQWGLFSLPALKNLPPDPRHAVGILEAARRGLRQTLQTISSVWAMRDLRRFLIAYFFYMDGVNTVIFFSSVFAATTLHFGKLQILGLFALVQLSALAGSFAMGAPTDRKGPKWAVRTTLLWWIGVVVAAFFAHEKLVFAVVAVLAGLGLGAIQAASRAFMSRLVPEGREAELFGFYALCGKTGSILGPLLFGVVSVATKSQRPAVLAVAVFYIAGFLLLRGVRAPTPAS